MLPIPHIILHSTQMIHTYIVQRKAHIGPGMVNTLPHIHPQVGDLRPRHTIPLVIEHLPTGSTLLSIIIRMLLMLVRRIVQDGVNEGQAKERRKRNMEVGEGYGGLSLLWD